MNDGVLVIVGCGSDKVWSARPEVGAVPATRAYTGSLFALQKAYALHFAERWLVLSALHGLVAPDFLVPGPYDVTMDDRARRVSTARVAEQLRVEAVQRFTRVIALAGRPYREVLDAAFDSEGLPAPTYPHTGLRMGWQKHALKTAVARNEWAYRAAGRA